MQGLEQLGILVGLDLRKVPVLGNRTLVAEHRVDQLVVPLVDHMADPWAGRRVARMLAEDSGIALCWGQYTQ